MEKEYGNFMNPIIFQRTTELNTWTIQGIVWKILYEKWKNSVLKLQLFERWKYNKT